MIWSGGNGPHDYVVAIDRWGARYAAALGDIRLTFYNPLRYVGVESFRTRVWIEEESSP